jgi:hypothetical protein
VQHRLAEGGKVIAGGICGQGEFGNGGLCRVVRGVIGGHSTLNI